MADISEILDAVRDAAAVILYPGGVPAGQMPASVVGSPLRIFVGWPSPDLDNDLRRGICQVSIWPRGMSREIRPYIDGWVSVPPPSPSLTAVAGDQVVTFGGTTVVPRMIAAVVVDYATAYSHAVAPGETPEAVVAALATLIAADRQATATGLTLHIPGAFALAAQVVSGGMERREIRRVTEGIQITAWCPTPALRDAIISRLDQAFADEYRTLLLPDGTKATLTYAGSPFDEEARAQPMHRRDLLLTAEFSSIQEREAPGIAVPTTILDRPPDVVRRTILSLRSAP